MDAINRYRGRVAQRALNPQEARWEPDDIVAEYKRLVSEGAIKG